MQNFSPEERKILREIKKQRGFLGTFNLEKDGIHVGSRVFKTLAAALTYHDKTNINIFETIQHGSKISTRPSSGSLYYEKLENLLDSLVANDSTLAGATFERSSHDYSGKTVMNMIEELKNSDGKITGFLHPSKGKLDILRLKTSAGKYLTDEDLVGRIGNVWGMQDADKVFKRLNTLFSLHQFSGHLPEGKVFKAHLFKVDPNNKAGSDALSVVRGSAVRRIAKQQEARALKLRADFPDTDMSPEAVTARRTANSLEETASEYRQLARTGGSAKNFRVSGFVDQQNDFIEGMIKSDVLVVPDKKFTRGMMAEHGLSREAAEGIDIVTGDINVTKELGRKKLNRKMRKGQRISGMSLEADHARGLVRYDLQSMTTHAGRLFTPEVLARHTLDIYKGQLDRYLATGELPQLYREQLEATLRREVPLSGGMAGLRQAQEEARAILAMADSPNFPTVEFANRIRKGMMDSLPHHKFKGHGLEILPAPNYILPATASAHLRGLTPIKKAGQLSDLSLNVDELRYVKGVGWVMDDQTLQNVKHLLGGSDQDDAVNFVLRRMENSENYKMIGIRNPNAAGESVVLDIDINKSEDLIELMGKHDERFRPELEELSRQRRILEKPNSIQEQILSVQEDLAEINKKKRALSSRRSKQTALDKIAAKKLSREGKKLSSRLEGHNKRLSEAVVAAADIDADMVATRYLSIARRMTTTISRDDLNLFGASRKGKTHIDPVTGLPDIDPKTGLSIMYGENPKEIYPKKSDAFMKHEDWKIKTGITQQELIDRIGIRDDLDGLRKGLQSIDSLQADSLTRKALKRALYDEIGDRAFGGLGGVVNVSMLADSMAPALEKAGLTGKLSLLATSEMETLVDTLIQGSGDLTLDDILERQQATLMGMAEAIVKHDVKLSPQIFDERGGMIKNRLKDLIADLDPTFFGEDEGIEKILGKSFYDEYADVFSNVVKREYDDIDRGAIRHIFGRDPSLSASFTLREIEEADKIHDIYQSTLDHYNQKVGKTIGTNVPELFPFVDDMTFPDVPRINATAAVEREFTRFLDQGKMTEEGTRILGAMLQRHRGGMSGILDRGAMPRLVGHAESFFHNEQGKMGELYDSLLAADPDDAPRIQSQIDAFQGILDEGVTEAHLHRGMNTYFDQDLEEGLDLVRDRPGFVRNARMDASYGRAADVTDGRAAAAKNRFYTRYSNAGFKDLWQESKLLRKGSMAAAGAVAFSALYSKLRDRSPEDMQGPPLLPGGSAYERMPQYDMEPDSLTPISDGRGGVTYKIVADGQYDPMDLQTAIGSIIGRDVPMSGSYYSSQSDRVPHPRYNRRKSDDALFGQV